MTAAVEEEHAWQRGYPRELLREISQLFAAHDRGMVRSRFGRFDDAEAARTLAAGSLRLIAGPDGQLAAAVVIRTARSSGSFSDWRGYRMSIPAGASRVLRMAGDPQLLAAQIAELRAPLYVEHWREHPAERGILEALALDLWAVKISAYSELRGIAAQDPPDRPLGDLDAQALAQLQVEVPAAQILAELRSCAPPFADHYSTYNERESWSACSLRGYSDDPAMIEKPSEMPKRWKAEHLDLLDAELRDTALFERFPTVRSFVESMGVAHRVRFMRLAPERGELSRHADSTDPDAGSDDGKLMRCHFPIVTNPAVRFSGWDLDGARQEAHMAVGEGWWLDTRKPHAATNSGSTERIHLVVDLEASAELRARAGRYAERVEQIIPQRISIPEDPPDRWSRPMVETRDPTAAGKMTEQSYVMVGLEELKTHPRNPRRGDAERIARSIMANDFYGALIVQRSTGFILAGNHRYEAAKIAGMAELPVIYVDVDDDRALRIMLVDNREADLAGYDDAELASLLQELAISDAELIGTGYTTEDLALLVASDRMLELEEEQAPPIPESYSIVDRPTIEAEAFRYWREHGFPYPDQPLHLHMIELNALAACSRDKLIHSHLGYRIADSYHPERWHAQVENKPTPFDAWADDGRLAVSIRIILDAHQAMTPSQLAHILAHAHGSQACWNFRPAFALAIYRMLAPPGATILDTSTGYGGRLVGFLASEASTYIGVDPAADTCAANARLVADLCPANKTVELHQQPAEDLDPQSFEQRCDLAFTSPPYFAKEHYTDEETQAWKRYPTIADWTDGFLVPMLRLQHASLKPGAANAINIADITIGKSEHRLVDLTIEHALHIGFVLDHVERFPLPRRFGANHEDEPVSEPVVILRRSA